MRAKVVIGALALLLPVVAMAGDWRNMAEYTQSWGASPVGVQAWDVHQMQMRQLQAGAVTLHSSRVAVPVTVLRSRGPGNPAWEVRIGEERWVKEWGLPARASAGLGPIEERTLVKQIFGVNGSLEEVWNWVTVTSSSTPFEPGAARGMPRSMWYGNVRADYQGWQVVQAHGHAVTVPAAFAIADRGSRGTVARIKVGHIELANPNIVGPTAPRR